MNTKFCILILIILIIIMIFFQINILFKTVNSDTLKIVQSFILHPESVSKEIQSSTYAGIKKNKNATTGFTLEEKMYPKLRNCSNITPRRRYVKKRKFWVLENYIRATKQFRCDESITYTTQGEFGFLNNLVAVAPRWKGPISVAVYAPGSDFDRAVKTIFYIRNCLSTEVKEYATFHLFFDTNNIPQNIPNLKEPDNVNVTCDKLNFPNVLNDATYRSIKNILYPINVARNIAKSNARTYFVFASDIELYPSPGIIPDFFKMLQKPDKFPKSARRVYVLPIFEIRKNLKAPETKKELVKMIRRRSAAVFHERICLSCHKVPNYRPWLREFDPELSVFSISKRQQRHRLWEPIYIGTNEEPIFDERLTIEGRADKMTQMYAMCLLDYDFHVLNNAFLVHKPGIKRRKISTVKNDVVKNQLHLIQNNIVNKYQKLYGENNNCTCI